MISVLKGRANSRMLHLVMHWPRVLPEEYRTAGHARFEPFPFISGCFPK